MKEEYYKIEKPFKDFNDFEQKDIFECLRKSETKEIIKKAQDSYLSWKDFRRKSWVLGNKELAWSLVKTQRNYDQQNSPIFDEQNNRFKFNPRSYPELLHKIDLELGGHFIGIENFSSSDKIKYIKRGLIEESIASSQLEGANTSRKAAKKMLNEGKKPKDKDEQMIFNNHKAMKWIEEELKNEDLSLDLIKKLHIMVTKDTIKDKHCGIFRENFDENGQPLVIKPWDDFKIVYTAPKKEFVEKEIKKFINFANDKDNSGFIHPVIKAIMLHFWMGLLHPFEDGNGRLARIIFYWYMLKKGYWAFAYISLSEFIKKSEKQYVMSFVNSEQDDNDLGYFIQYNISKIKLARKSFEEYVARKISESHESIKLVKRGYDLNSRQTKLLRLFFEKELEYSSLKDHMAANNIGRVTASFDLKGLVEDGFLTKIKVGRDVFYESRDKINELFKSPEL